MDKSLRGRVQRMPLRRSAIRWLALGRQQLLVTNNFGYGWGAAPLLHVADEEKGNPYFLKKDWGCAAARAVARTGAMARVRETRGQQQQQDQGRRCDNSCEDYSKGDAARQGQHGNNKGILRQRQWQGQQ